MEQEIDWANKIYKKITLMSPNGIKKIICYSGNGIHFTEPFSNETFLLISRENMINSIVKKETLSLGNIRYELGNYSASRNCIIKNVGIRQFYRYICDTKKRESVIKYIQKEKQSISQMGKEKQKVKRYSDKINQVFNI